MQYKRASNLKQSKALRHDDLKSMCTHGDGDASAHVVTSSLMLRRVVIKVEDCFDHERGAITDRPAVT